MKLCGLGQRRWVCGLGSGVWGLGDIFRVLCSAHLDAAQLSVGRHPAG